MAFWPEVVMHNGINSSADDVKSILPEIAENVVDSTLLSIEQRRLKHVKVSLAMYIMNLLFMFRHILVISYLVALLLFMMVVIFVLVSSKKCECGTGTVL